MDRRNFLQLAALAIAGQAAERVFPFRVYSIPAIMPAVPKEVFEYMKTLEANMELLTGAPSAFQVLPVVGTIYGADGSPSGHIKIKSVNGNVLTCSTGVVRCRPGDLIVLENEIYPVPHKTDARTGQFLNLQRS